MLSKYKAQIFSVLAMLILFFTAPQKADAAETYVVTNEAELVNAVADAETGDVIMLENSITITAPLIMTKAGEFTFASQNGVEIIAMQSRHFGFNTAEFTLNFDKVTLNGGNLKGGFYFASEVDITLNGLVIKNCRAIDDSGQNRNGGAICQSSVIATGFRCTVNNGRFEGCQAIYGGAVYISAGASFTANNCVWVNNNTQSQAGGGCHIQSCMSVALNGCVFENNYSAANGGALSYSASATKPGTITMDDCVFRANSANSSGGAIYLLNEITGEFNRCVFAGNSANKNNGGAFYAVQVRSLTLKDSTIGGDDPEDSNTSAVLGGGVHVYSTGSTETKPVLNLINCKVKNNSSAQNGGGIATSIMVENTFVTLNVDENTEINGNTAVNGGGIALTLRGNLNVAGGTRIINNHAENGGAVWLDLYATDDNLGIFLQDATIEGNTASNEGGALFVNGRTLTVSLDNMKILNNHANSAGGGISISAIAKPGVNRDYTISISDDTVISGNTAEFGGGIYAACTADSGWTSRCAITSEGNIKENHAMDDGGGIYAVQTHEGEISLNLDGTIEGNTVGRDGGAIWINDCGMLKTNDLKLSKNYAPRGYLWTLDTASDNDFIKYASEVHLSNIKNTTFTAPFTNAYSNYDVNIPSVEGYMQEYTGLFTVRFDSKGGGEFEPLYDVPYGSTIEPPPEPFREDFTFEGWFTFGGKLWDFQKDVVVSDMTLYAGWAPVTQLGPAFTKFIYGDNRGMVYPDASLTRAEAAAMLFRVLTEADKGEHTESNFADLNPKLWYYHEVAYLEKKGIVLGYGGTIFRPDEHITRAEFIKLVSALDSVETASGNYFADVPVDYWAAGYINNAAAKGWIVGVDGNKFMPEAGVSRAHAVLMLSRITGRPVKPPNLPSYSLYADLPMSHPEYYHIMSASIDID